MVYGCFCEARALQHVFTDRGRRGKDCAGRFRTNYRVRGTSAATVGGTEYSAPVAQDLPQTVAATFSVEVATVAVTLMEGGFVGRLRVEWKVIINVPMTSIDLPSRDRLL